jgi:concanavalin A-like lectin/glucanase superfamily protein
MVTMTRFFPRAFACFALLALSSAVEAQIAGGMLFCDGTSDYAAIPNAHGDFDFDTAMTIEAWIRPDSFLDFRAAVSGATSAFNLQEGTSGKPLFTVSVPSTASATGLTSMVAGAWTHLAGTYDGTDIRLYVNGVDAAIRHNPGDVTGVSEIRLCRHSSDEAFFFHGAIDEVRIWNIVRTEAEIAATYNRKIGSQEGLVGYYRFDEGSGQTLIDSSTHGNNGFLGATNAAGNDDPTRLPSSAPLVGGGNCVSSASTACLLGGRFEVKVTMWNFQNPAVAFQGMVQTYNGQSSQTDQSASFFSFQNGNVEVFVKMVNACSAGSHSFWLFAAGATTAETQILVRDTVAEETVQIYNPRNVLFESVADTQAFRTCDV